MGFDTIGFETAPAVRTEVAAMAKYLIEASYTQDGFKGLLKEGGTARRAAIESAVKGVSGSVDALYYVFGEDDIIFIVDVPDNVGVAALSLAFSSSGKATSTVRVLLTPEEIDAAVKKTVEYRAPGG